MSDELETRHYIGLMGSGTRVTLTAGPGRPEEFPVPANEPVSAEAVTYYPVSAEIAEEWTADEAGEPR